MKRRLLIVILPLAILLILGLPLSGVLNATTPLNVTMQRYNLSRNAVNTNETVLNIANVKDVAHGGTANNFGKLFSDAVDGDIYTQPLIVNGLNIPNKGTYNVVFVATMHNTVYAFDADKAGPPLWSKNFGTPWHGDCRSCVAGPPAMDPGDIPGGEDGILADPAIDIATNTMYLVTHHDGDIAGNVLPKHVLHALDMSTGVEKYGGPIVITASISPVNGTDSHNGVITFDSGQELARPALTLLQGRVLVAMGATGDSYPFHGWLFAYNQTNLQASPAVWLTTPQGYAGGIWMAGSGPVIDSNNNIYLITGNGDYGMRDGTTNPPAGPNVGDYSDSVMKLSLDTTLNKFNIVDYFTPWNQAFLDAGDYDLGSSNFVLIPGTHLLFGGGKTNVVYLLDTNNMGRYVCDEPSNSCSDPDSTANHDTNIVQEWNGKASHLHNTPNVWTAPNGDMLVYMLAEQDMLKAYKFDPLAGNFPGNPPIPVSSNGLIQNFGMPSGMISISSNGTTAGTGIAWTTDWKSNFRAVDATDVSKILWTDKDSPRDGLGVGAKFVVPVVANGRVYMATRSGRLSVYGLLPSTPLGGSLGGAAVSAPTSMVNLSTEGVIDWAHWGRINNISFDHKMGTNGPVNLISPIVTKGGGPIQITNSPTSYIWTDGTPTTMLTSATTTGLETLPGETYEEVPSFQITVPADTTPKILKVYVSASNAQGQLRVSLSDGSAVDFVDATDPNLTGNDFRVYTLTYQAASDNQLLFVTWSMLQDNGSGFITFQSASLGPFYVPDVPPQPSFQPPTNTPFAATSTRTPTPGPSPTPSRTPTPMPADSFRVKYAALNIRDTELQIRAAVNVVNLTTVAANMTEFKLRYYFSKDGSGNLVFKCEAAVINCSKVHGAFASVTPTVDGADTYLELTFDSQALPQSGGSSGAIQFSIAKDTGSTFNQTNDFSYDGSLTSFTDSRRVALYRNNTLIWGSLPTLVATSLIAPADGTTNQPSHPTLQWTANESASRYQVRVVRNNATVFQQWYSASSICSGATCSVSPNVTLPDGTYSWFVETGTPAQNGPWSATWTFKVGP